MSVCGCILLHYICSNLNAIFIGLLDWFQFFSSINNHKHASWDKSILSLLPFTSLLKIICLLLPSLEILLIKLTNDFFPMLKRLFWFISLSRSEVLDIVSGSLLKTIFYLAFISLGRKPPSLLSTLLAPLSLPFACVSSWPCLWKFASLELHPYVLTPPPHFLPGGNQCVTLGSRMLLTSSLARLLWEALLCLSHALCTGFLFQALTASHT